MPGLVCITCTHPDVRAIDAAFLAGRRATSIAKQFGLGYSTVQRHKAKGHVQQMVEPVPGQPSPITPAMKSATEGVRALIVGLESRSVADMGPTAYTQYVRELRLAYESQAKMEGPAAPQEFDASTSAVWVEMRELMVDALRPFPEAYAAVMAATKKFEEPK